VRTDWHIQISAVNKFQRVFIKKLHFKLIDILLTKVKPQPKDLCSEAFIGHQA